jgi:hypothetical protein
MRRTTVAAAAVCGTIFQFSSFLVYPSIQVKARYNETEGKICPYFLKNSPEMRKIIKKAN